jgi:hypothetical protein
MSVRKRRRWSMKNDRELIELAKSQSLEATTDKVQRSPANVLKQAGANRIRSADDAYSFLAHLRPSYQTKPHWQAARQALDNVCASHVSENQAWRTFRAAVSAEGWLMD